MNRRAGDRRGSLERLEQVEGRQPVLAALRAGRRRVRRVFVQEGLELGEVRSAARSAGARVDEVTADELAAMARTDAPQGVVARCDPLPIASLEEVVVPAPALVVVLDGVIDPRNLGAAARAAEAAGATGLVVSRHRGSPLTPAGAKAAAGAFEHLPVAVVAGIPSALRELKERDLWIVVLDGDGETSIWDLPVAGQPLALVVGSEGRGAARLVKDRADVIARIPLFGQIPSLNAATAAAVALFEVRRARGSLA